MRHAFKERTGSHPLGARGAAAWIRLLTAVALCLPGAPSVGEGPAAEAVAPAVEAHLKDIAYENNRLRIALDGNAAYRVFSLSQPPRLVIELARTVHAAKPYEVSVDDGVLKRIRCAQFQTAPDKVTRVVLDLQRVLPYETSKQGNDIVLLFVDDPAAKAAAAPSAARRGTGDAARSRPGQSDGAALSGNVTTAAPTAPEVAPAHKTALPDTLAGADEASVTAGAATAPPAGVTPSGAPASGKRTKDLLAALPKHPVTIEFDDADIRDVIRVLSEMSGINMIHTNDLRGVLRIHLDQVPFNEAFNTILSMQGLVAQQMGENILRILTPEALSSDRSRSVTTYKTFTLNYAKASDIMLHLESVKISPNAKASVDDRTNSLIVTDTPEGLAAAERLIAELDQKPQQVMIEAKMVEVLLSSNLDLGIQWEYSQRNTTAQKTQIIGQRDIGTGTQVAAGEAGFVTGSGVEKSVTPTQRGTGVNLPGPGTAAITFGFINNSNLLTATLSALAQKGQTKILSAPKIITVNNKQAKIQVGSKIPFQITTVSAAGLATQSFQFVDVGVILTVTPTINADNRIRILVKPEVSVPGNATPAGPEINTRTAETEVLIRDGETLVIGGLIDEQMRESAQKMPLLGDIPVLGVFFRSTSDSKRRSELLVFLTPKIIRE